MLNTAYINLNTLRQNAINIKERLLENQKFCAVVKADAYGHGSVPVASALYNIADCFAVALPEEAIELRLGGIDKEILLLVPLQKEDIEISVFYGFTISVQSVEEISLINKECERQKKRCNIHLIFNSGMNRFGVDSLFELKNLLDYAKDCHWIKVGGMFSHFANPSNKKSLKKAEKKFLLAYALVKEHNSQTICHVSASGGFLMGAKSDMVRIGILLYGYKPFKTNQIDVKPIMKIYSPVICKRTLKRGESALYGDKKSKKNVEISLVRVGYADGFFRKSGGGRFSNRCMDITAYKNREYLRLLPVFEDADMLAKENRTINYEVLTQVAKRTEKIYLS